MHGKLKTPADAKLSDVASISRGRPHANKFLFGPSKLERLWDDFFQAVPKSLWRVENCNEFIVAMTGAKNLCGAFRAQQLLAISKFLAVK